MPALSCLCGIFFFKFFQLGSWSRRSLNILTLSRQATLEVSEDPYHTEFFASFLGGFSPGRGNRCFVVNSTKFCRTFPNVHLKFYKWKMSKIHLNLEILHGFKQAVYPVYFGGIWRILPWFTGSLNKLRLAQYHASVIPSHLHNSFTHT